MVMLRIDHRLRGRVDPSDVLQEAFLDLSKRLPSWSQNRSIPLFLWMRLVTGERLMRIHRRHLSTGMRDAARDVSLDLSRGPQVDSESLAAELAGSVTSPSDQVMRKEIQLQLQNALNGMDDIDREIIALRNFEELDNPEAAAVLQLAPETARKRYVRALKRLQSELRRIPGLVDS